MKRSLLILVAAAEGVAYVSARESRLFIAQRHFGVERVDVSDPARPRHQWEL